MIAWEDWGLQDRLMLSPEVWRAQYLPPMREMIRHIHSRGLKYVLHTCGNTLEIMGDFLDAGVDVLQLDQQINMGLTMLHEFAGHVCFFSPADIIFMSGNTDLHAIRDYCIDMADRLSTPNGGFMYKVYGQPGSVHTPVESVVEECRVFSSYNPYRVDPEGRVRGSA